MTIIVATRDFIAADSRLSFGVGEAPLTVGKIFKRKGGGLFATAGDSRLTHHFERAMKRGVEPKEMELLEDEAFEAVMLTKAAELVVYDSNFAPFLFLEGHIAIGGPRQVAQSWILNPTPGASAMETVLTAIRRCIEVDSGCGFPIVVARLDGSFEVIEK